MKHWRIASTLGALALTALMLGLVGGSTLAAAHPVPVSTPKGLAPGAAGALAASGRSTSPALTPCGFPRCLLITLGTSTGVGSFAPGTNFNTGSVGNANEVFFQICDFALDHTANITILDPNATSDGLSNPLFDQSVPLVFAPGSGCPGGTSFDSTLAPQLFYQLPRSLVQGGQWEFNATAGTNGWSEGQVNFQVATYYVALTQDQSDHLPLDRATVFYQVLSYVTQGPLSGRLGFGVNGLYVNSTRPYWVTALPPLTPPSTQPQGSISFQIPSNAQTGTWVTVNLWSNLTANGRTTSASSRVYFTVAQVLAPQLCAATTTNGGPAPCPTPLAFPEGSELVVRETAVMGTLLGGVLGVIPGATITLQLYSGGIPIGSPSTFPTVVQADSSGTAREVLDTTVIKQTSITINVTVADPNDPALTNHSSLSISLLGNSSQVAVAIQLNSSQYYGGDTVGGSFQLVMPGGNGGLPAYWTAYAYQFYFLAGSKTCPLLPLGQLEGQGNMTGVSGALPSYTLATTMSGIVEVVLFAHNGSSATTGGIFSMACALVSPPQILVNPSEVTYLPGDAITVTIAGEGSVLTNGHPTYYANVVGFATATGHNPCTGSTMQVLFGGAVTGTSFLFNVPAHGASVCYEVSVSAQTTTGFISGEDVELDEASGFLLTASVTTASSYTDGSFQPGQTISVAYSLTAVGLATLPRSVTLMVQLGVQPATRTQQATTSGTLSVTIPSGQGGGLLLISLQAQVTDPTAAGGVASVSAVTGVMVHPNPSWLDEELSPGGGFTNGDVLIVVALAILVAVGLFLWWRGRWESPRERYHFQHTSPPEESAPEVTSPSPAPSVPPSSSDELAPPASNYPDVSGPPLPPPAAPQPSPPPLPPPMNPGPPQPPMHGY